MVKYHHNLNAAILRAMGKLYDAGGPTNLRELGLDRNEWDNFQKLRYWDFVVQVAVDGKRQRGVWAVTETGAAFLRGETTAHAGVWTYRGERTEFTGDLKRVTDYLSEAWKQREEYAAEAQPI